MKVRCIDDSGMFRRSPITKGKVYPVIDVISECYNIINDNGEEWCYLKSRFEEVKEVEKEKVLEVEFQDVVDKVAWKITYQNTSILKRDVFRDKEIGVVSHFIPYFDGEILFIQGFNDWKDSEMNIASKEEAEIIKRKVDAINEKYGLIKRWRANYDGKYFVVGNDGVIFEDVDKRYDTDDRRYILGNYFKTKNEAQAELEKIKQILQGE